MQFLIKVGVYLVAAASVGKQNTSCRVTRVSLLEGLLTQRDPDQPGVLRFARLGEPNRHSNCTGNTVT